MIGIINLLANSPLRILHGVISSQYVRRWIVVATCFERLTFRDGARQS
jgi:hypothetical protein